MSQFSDRFPKDNNPARALQVLNEWIATGRFSMPTIRNASLAAHRSAGKAERNTAASFAAHAAGQAVGTAHVPTHALGAALYGTKAAAVASGNPEIAVLKERNWQLRRLAKNLRPWVQKWLEHLDSRKGITNLERARKPSQTK